MVWPFLRSNVHGAVSESEAPLGTQRRLSDQVGGNEGECSSKRD